MPTISGGSLYPKFKTIGDTVTGELVSFEVGQTGTFGPEDVATLLNAEGETMYVRAGKALSKMLAVNADKLTGKVITITYVKDGVAKKGMHPPKLFTISYDEDLSFPPKEEKPALNGDEAELEKRLAEARARRAA